MLIKLVRKILLATLLGFVSTISPSGAMADATIKKVSAPPGQGSKVLCQPSDYAAGRCGKNGGGANGSSNGAKALGIPISKEAVEEQNKKAKSHVVKNDQFISESNNERLKSAMKATVQILPKCAIGITGNTYTINGIGAERSEFCPGHPLSGSRLPSQPEGIKTLAGEMPKDKACEVKPCSGALIGSQDTITTEAHCLGGKSPKDFCDQYVFVFNRTDGKTNFSKDEIAECESGTSVDTNSTIANFNTNAESKSKDHAVLKLKESVNTDVAQALSLRKTALNSQEEVYAVGYPQGTTRAISKMKNPNLHAASSADYSYIHMDGYVYPGNSGGPLIDKNGLVVGILAAVDDNQYGDADDRDPKYSVEGVKGVCRSQAAPGPYRVEAVGYGKELSDLLKATGGETSKSDPVVEETVR